MSDNRPAGGHTTQASHSLPFQPGDVLAGRYRIKRYVAQGAVGVIFEARDMELGVDVAIKVLRSELADRPATVKRFRREVQLVIDQASGIDVLVFASRTRPETVSAGVSSTGTSGRGDPASTTRSLRYQSA